MADGQIGVMLASRRFATRRALLDRLAGEPWMRLVGAPVVEPSQLPDRINIDSPDVLLADDALLRMDPASMRRLHQRRPCLRVLLWCDKPTDGLVATILDHRFDGFLLARDPPETVQKAMRAVCRGELWVPRAMLSDALRNAVTHAEEHVPFDATPALVDALGVLTRREAEVVAHLRLGCTNKEIGRKLGIMEDTVKKHLKGVFAKLGVHRRGLVMLRRAPASLDDR